VNEYPVHFIVSAYKMVENGVIVAIRDRVYEKALHEVSLLVDRGLDLDQVLQ
jgi:hypothetical protein